MKVHAKFVAAAAAVPQFPPAGLPEIAFLGRSNVGKSSLINSLLGAKVARTSSVPGRTRSINFFEVRRAGRPQPELLFVDLPGYGYARLPRAITEEWPLFIEPYLKERETLALCVVLVDAKIPAQPGDRQLLEFLRDAGRPHLVVPTKADRLAGGKLPQALRALQEELAVERVLPYSARTGAGRDSLWREIRSAAGLEK